MRTIPSFLAVFLLVFSGVSSLASDVDSPGSAGSSCNYVPGAALAFHTDGRFIRDQYGRAALLRGVNTTSPYHAELPFDTEDLDRLERFGFNFVRLGLAWKYIEPEEGEFDGEYLKDFREFLEAGSERGIYMMPEIHQVQWCTGYGQVPAWMCETTAEHGMDDEAIRKETDRFWHSEELQGKFANAWLRLVEEFKDVPGLFGYNLLNEPFSYDGLVYGKFEKCCLFPFYHMVIREIRKVDPDTPVILDPHPMTTVLPAYAEPFPFDNIIYAPHTYFPHGYGPGGLEVFGQETPGDVRSKYRRYDEDAGKMGVPWLVGEYGAVAPGKYPFVVPWFEENVLMQDRYFVGSAVWVYRPTPGGWSITDADGELLPYAERMLHRPYPRYTAGTPGRLHYDPDERFFGYRYTAAAGCAPTEIYCPAGMCREDSIRVSGDCTGAWSYDGEREIILIPPGCTGEITVEAKLETGTAD